MYYTPCDKPCLHCMHHVQALLGPPRVPAVCAVVVQRCPTGIGQYHLPCKAERIYVREKVLVGGGECCAVTVTVFGQDSRAWHPFGSQTRLMGAELTS